MAYPEAIAPLRPKEGKEFLRRLQRFRLTDEQKRFWAAPEETRLRDE